MCVFVRKRKCKKKKKSKEKKRSSGYWWGRWSMWDPKKLTFYLGCYIQGAKTKERKRRAKTLSLDV